MRARKLAGRSRPGSLTPAPDEERDARQAAALGASRAASLPPGHPTSTSDLLALQRSVGNSRGNRVLDERTHPDAVGRAPVLHVQRIENDQRHYGEGGLKRPVTADQADLEKVFPRNEDGSYQKFPDPFADPVPIASSLVRSVAQTINKIHPKGRPAGSGGAADWVQAINPRRADKDDDSYRRNCIDAVRSFVASWSGKPTVAAGVYDPTPPGLKEDEDPPVEKQSDVRTADWLRTDWKVHEAAPGEKADGVWKKVGEQLTREGHGSLSLIVFERQVSKSHRRVHAVCGVNYKGSVVWVDPQQGKVGSSPMYKGGLYMTITLNPDFRPVEAPYRPTALRPYEVSE